MSGLRHSKFTRIATLLALLLQLGVIAFHHHDTLESHVQLHSESHWHHAHADTDHDEHESEHASDEHGHEDPADDHDECDLCALKTTAAGPLVLGTVDWTIIVEQSTEFVFALTQIHRVSSIYERYQPRAPPLQAAVS